MKTVSGLQALESDGVRRRRVGETVLSRYYGGDTLVTLPFQQWTVYRVRDSRRQRRKDVSTLQVTNHDRPVKETQFTTRTEENSSQSKSGTQSLGMGGRVTSNTFTNPRRPRNIGLSIIPLNPSEVRLGRLGFRRTTTIRDRSGSPVTLCIRLTRGLPRSLRVGSIIVS